jgi:hypothetical protein
MGQITCPKCKEQVSLKNLCENCGADLRELVKKAEAEEEQRKKEQRRRAEEQRRKQREAEEEQRQKQYEAEEEQRKQREANERRERWEQEQKARAKRNAVIIAAVVIVAAAITAKIVYEKARPDIWTPVSSGTEITGTWQGRTALPPTFVSELLKTEDIPANVNIILETTLNNMHDPEKIHTIIKFDIAQLLKVLALKEGDLPAFVVDEYVSVAEINQIGQVFINHRNTKLKWQLDFTQSGGLVSGLDNVECILEKTAEAKTYKLGNFGEAGIVFYDKGSYSDGWRYLEVSLEFIRDTSWSNGSGFIKGLKTTIGDGDFNTSNIINFLGEDTAAYAAASYRGGGKNDWYLGNNKEMQMCFKALRGGIRKRRAKKQSDFEKLDRGIWGDAPSYIWTSEQKSDTEAYQIELTKFLWDRGGSITAVNVLPHKILFGLTDDAKDPVRPIRKF